MKFLMLFSFLFFLTACSTTKYELAPELCPEPVKIVVPEPPTAVTEEPVASNFLKRFHEYFGAANEY